MAAVSIGGLNHHTKLPKKNFSKIVFYIQKGYPQLNIASWNYRFSIGLD